MRLKFQTAIVATLVRHAQTADKHIGLNPAQAGKLRSAGADVKVAPALHLVRTSDDVVYLRSNGSPTLTVDGKPDGAEKVAFAYGLTPEGDAVKRIPWVAEQLVEEVEELPIDGAFTITPEVIRQLTGPDAYLVREVAIDVRYIEPKEGFQEGVRTTMRFVSDDAVPLKDGRPMWTDNDAINAYMEAREGYTRQQDAVEYGKLPVELHRLVDRCIEQQEAFAQRKAAMDRAFIGLPEPKETADVPAEQPVWYRVDDFKQDETARAERTSKQKAAAKAPATVESTETPADKAELDKANSKSELAANTA